MKDPARKLKEAIARLAQRSSAKAQVPLDITPGCAFGAIEEQRLQGLEKRLDEIQGQVNGLLYTLVAAVILEIVMRLI